MEPKSIFKNEPYAVKFSCDHFNPIEFNDLYPNYAGKSSDFLAKLPQLLKCPECHHRPYSLKVKHVPELNISEGAISLDTLKTSLLQMQLIPNPDIQDSRVKEHKRAIHYRDHCLNPFANKGAEAEFLLSQINDNFDESYSWSRGVKYSNGYDNQNNKLDQDDFIKILRDIRKHKLAAIQSLADVFGCKQLVHKIGKRLGRVFPALSEHSSFPTHLPLFKNVKMLSCSFYKQSTVQALYSLPSLKEIHIEGINDDVANKLKEFLLAKPEQLQSFCLDSWSDKSTSKQIATILDGLCAQVKLNELTIYLARNENEDYSSAGASLHSLLSKNKNISNLYLWVRNQAFVEALCDEDYSNIQSLHILGTSSKEDKSYFQKIIDNLHRFPNLRELTLWRFYDFSCSMDTPGEERRIPSLASLQNYIKKYGSQLVCLNLLHTYFTEDAIEELSNALADATNLRVLNLDNCFLTEKSFLTLCKGIQKCPALEAFSMDDWANFHWFKVGENRWNTMREGASLLKNHPNLKAFYCPKFDSNKEMRDIVKENLRRLKYVNFDSVERLTKEGRLRASAEIPLTVDNPDYDSDLFYVRQVMCEFGGPDDMYERMGIEYCAKRFLNDGVGIINGINYRAEVYEIVRDAEKEAKKLHDEKKFDEKSFSHLVCKKFADANVPLKALQDILNLAYPPAVWSTWSSVKLNIKDMV